jgi:two-component system, NarL family, response regulator LiaR
MAVQAAAVEPLRILLAEDHAMVREGTRQLLSQVPGFQVVGEAGRGDTAVELAAELRPDVLVLDLRLPGMNGIEVARRVSADLPGTRVLIVSAYNDDDYVIEALRAGATGYLLKTAPARELIGAVRSVATGSLTLSAEVSQQLAAHMLRGGGSPAARSVSPRELEVLRLIAQGLPNKEIAARLQISQRTVEGHLNSIFDKLGVASRTEAVYQALHQHLIEIDT